MGYDLILRPRKRELDEQTFVELFNDRRHYRFPDEDPSVAAYFNPSTEVYFHFRWTEPREAEPKGALAFSINFFRPPTFALEAETEVAEIVESLDLAVEDPQTEGIDGDVYDGDQFLAGWVHGNDLAYKAILAEPDRPGTLFHLPADTVQRIWEWNFVHEDTAEATGGGHSVPLIGYAKYAGERLVTIATIDLERAFLLPRVDYVYIVRGGRKTFVSWDEISMALVLTDGDAIEDPWPHWAVVASESRALDPLLKGNRPTAPIDSLDVQDVHTTEDVVEETRSYRSKR